MKKPELTGVLSPILLGGIFIASFFAKFAARFDKIKVIRIAFAIIFVCIGIRLITRDASIPVMIAAQVGIGISTGFVSVFLIPLFMDCIEYGEYKTKVRSEALTFSAVTAQNKIGLGVGTAMLGFILNVGGYKAGTSAQSGAVLNVLFGVHLIPFLIASIISFILLCFYKLNAEKMEEIMRLKSAK